MLEDIQTIMILCCFTINKKNLMNSITTKKNPFYCCCIISLKYIPNEAMQRLVEKKKFK